MKTLTLLILPLIVAATAQAWQPAPDSMLTVRVTDATDTAYQLHGKQVGVGIAR